MNKIISYFSNVVYVDEGDKRLFKVFCFWSLVLGIKIMVFTIQNAGVDF